MAKETSQPSVSINPELIAKFEAETENNNDSKPGSGSDSINLDGVAQTVQFSLENINKFLKGQGLPGWNEKDTGEYTKLAVVIAKRNIRPEWLNNSPEFLGLAILGTIAAENILALRKIQAGFNGQEKPEKSEND